MRIRAMIFLGFCLLVLFLAWGMISTREKVPCCPSSLAEKLMRDHGWLNRMLLVYDDLISRIDNQEEVSPDLIKRAAQMVSQYLEGFHEEFEEQYIFRKFEKNNIHPELIRILIEQHQRGRELTQHILTHAEAAQSKVPQEREDLADSMQSFVDIYRVHSAFEDTELFPRLGEAYTCEEYQQAGEALDQQQKAHTGGFRCMVEKVAALEKELGLYGPSIEAAQ